MLKEIQTLSDDVTENRFPRKNNLKMREKFRTNKISTMTFNKMMVCIPLQNLTIAIRKRT